VAGFEENSVTLQHFWKWLKNSSEKQKANVLQFGKPSKN
jgi:hypothetical protein